MAYILDKLELSQLIKNARVRRPRRASKFFTVCNRNLHTVRVQWEVSHVALRKLALCINKLAFLSLTLWIVAVIYKRSIYSAAS